MSVRKDLNRAKRRGDLADRVRIDIRAENGIVREVRAAALAGPPPSTGSIADIPFVNAAEVPDSVVIRRWQRDSWQQDSWQRDSWQPVTARQFAGDVIRSAKGLVAAGLPVEGRVALMARTSYEWTVLDFAIWAAGGQTVPIYPTSSAEQIEWILRDSGANHLIVETSANARTA